MNKESLKKYLSNRYQGWNSFLKNVIFPILERMTSKIAMKQKF